MTDNATATTAIQDFIQRWENSGAAERANYQLFLGELCQLLSVAPPDPAQADDRQNAYVFERNVVFHYPDGTSSAQRIDLYKRSCFVLETKQGGEKKDGRTEGQAGGGNLLFPSSAPKQKKDAAVRISMTVATAGEHSGLLQKVVAERSLGTQAPPTAGSGEMRAPNRDATSSNDAGGGRLRTQETA